MAVAKKTAAKPVAKTPVVEKVEVSTKPKWEYKDRIYLLTGDKSPLTLTLPSKHSSGKPLLYWDEEKQEQQEIRYATNMTSPFISEQSGHATLGHIMFIEGSLAVPKEQVALQKLLSLYHPAKDSIYEEYDPVGEAVDEIEYMDAVLEAQILARDMDIEKAEAIMRAEIGNDVNKMSSKELKRDLRIFAKSNPGLFLELAEDEDLELRNLAIKATEQQYLVLSNDQRLFSSADSGRKVMSVPFDENPYSAMAAFFKTDEGVSLYKSLSKKVV